MNVAATEKPITKRPGTTPPQLIVVAASNKRNGPEAAYFPGTDKKRVEKAAKCLGASTLEVSSKALETLASKLPRGKLLSNGKVTLEAVDERVFRQLAAYVPVAQRGAVRQTSHRHSSPIPSEVRTVRKPSPRTRMPEPKPVVCRGRENARSIGD